MDLKDELMEEIEALDVTSAVYSARILERQYPTGWITLEPIMILTVLTTDGHIHVFVYPY